MVFQPGQSGNPSGTRGRKFFIDALQAFISDEWNGSLPDLPKKCTVAHALAHKLLSEALSQTNKPEVAIAYIKEICDRAYGKAHQSVSAEVNVNHSLVSRINNAEARLSGVKPILLESSKVD